jgi:RNA polymerase sigma-70 factor, ECF subfamily
MADSEISRDALYEEAVATYGAALARLARSYEPDRHRCEDLLQEIHLALWTSLATFNGRCSLRTWTYRVAHNTAVSQVTRRRVRQPSLVRIEDLEEQPAAPPDGTDASLMRQRLSELIQTLTPVDRQLVLLYLEDLDATAIADIVGLTPVNVATKVHRLKKLLAQRFHLRDDHDA